ncbi:DNA cytosine methyltransferase [Paenibacillus tianjinensis]|uniref:Cytosine-specific methyltransferase n=1 Tax=Paenibacillus tianjinensis TaxID=2810347 RepID=A0ABX7LBM5_9BACL|nr:DNA cytosine methyltransferase [Paenibacillus tianjinensis]QSF43382.1 DNA cytosine methyltransferase [Paenibacillus tianjinensis]
MKQQENNGLKLIDLFCGAGIGAVGFKLAGYNIVDALDNKKYAVDTYNKNIGNHARVVDIRKINGYELPKADVIVGGFPCKPFSEGGAQRGEEDEANGDLGKHFLRLIKEAKPKAFIVENVKGLTFKKHEKFLSHLLTTFEELGYNVCWKLINCYEYGVPQERERVFIVGIHNSLNKTFCFPEPISTDGRKHLVDAIGDLPCPGENHSVSNHKEYYDGGFSPRYVSRNRQRQWDEPSFTIVSTARQLPLHPSPPNYDIRKMDEYSCEPPRRFTVRECLRIQSVPDWFSFGDDIALDKQYERCSGIPSLFAYILGKSLADQINL